MTQVAPGQQRLGLQPIKHGELVVTQLLVGVGLLNHNENWAIFGVDHTEN
jgi:hypothetical protein